MTLKGFLTHWQYKPPSTPQPTFISAPFLADEIGLVHSVSVDAPDGVASTPYWNCVSIEAQRKDGSNTKITGSVFGSIPHITQVDEYKDSFAFIPDGKYMLTFRNLDRPGEKFSFEFYERTSLYFVTI